MRPLSGLVLALCSTVFCSPALAADGEAVGVDPSAVAQTQNVQRVLIHGSEISVGDRIITGAQGEVQILFSEGTRLVVGPSAALLIERYLLRNAGSADAVAVDALSGTFRFITGSSPHEAYEITTPTGTIGVRGTAFDFYATETSTTVVLFNGATELCTFDGQCIVLTEPCQIGTIGVGGVGLVAPGDPVREELEDVFPYIQTQTELRRPFRVADADECLDQRGDFRTVDGGSSGGGGEPRPTPRPDGEEPSGEPTPDNPGEPPITETPSDPPVTETPPDPPVTETPPDPPVTETPPTDGGSGTGTTTPPDTSTPPGGTTPPSDPGSTDTPPRPGTTTPPGTSTPTGTTTPTRPGSTTPPSTTPTFRPPSSGGTEIR